MVGTQAPAEPLLPQAGVTRYLYGTFCILFLTAWSPAWGDGVQARVYFYFSPIQVPWVWERRKTRIKGKGRLGPWLPGRPHFPLECCLPPVASMSLEQSNDHLKE